MLDMMLETQSGIGTIEKNNMKIEVNRNGKWVQMNPNELTNVELCKCLSNIQIDSDEFISQLEIDEGYTAINEAMMRLGNDG